MTSVAGWYPDPQAPQHLRWWDGYQWTAHTAPIPTGSLAAPASFSRSTVSRTRWVVGAVVGVAVVLVAVALPVAIRANQRNDACAPLRTNSSMSPQTEAFANAVNRANAAGMKLSKQLNAEPAGNVTDDELRTLIANTLAFRDNLKTIPFTGSPLVDANIVIAGLSALARDLGDQIAEPNVSLQSLIQRDYSEADTARLRFDLGLPKSNPACVMTSAM